MRLENNIGDIRSVAILLRMPPNPILFFSPSHTPLTLTLHLTELSHLRVIGLDRSLEQLHPNRQTNNSNCVTLSQVLVKAETIQRWHGEGQALRHAAGVDEISKPSDEADTYYGDDDVD